MKPTVANEEKAEVQVQRHRVQPPRDEFFLSSSFLAPRTSGSPTGPTLPELSPGWQTQHGFGSGQEIGVCAVILSALLGCTSQTQAGGPVRAAR